MTNVRTPAASRGLSRLVQLLRKSRGEGGGVYISRTRGKTPLCVSGSEGKVGYLSFSPLCFLPNLLANRLRPRLDPPRSSLAEACLAPPLSFFPVRADLSPLRGAEYSSLTSSRLNEPSSPREPQKCHCVVSPGLPSPLPHSLSLSPPGDGVISISVVMAMWRGGRKMRALTSGSRRLPRPDGSFRGEQEAAPTLEKG